MTAAQVNPTPKARFQESDANIKAHHALLENPDFQRAEDFTLLSYHRSVAFAQANDANPQVAAMVAGWKLAGVQEFLHEFRTLAEKPLAVMPPGQARTLDHKN